MVNNFYLSTIVDLMPFQFSACLIDTALLGSSGYFCGKLICVKFSKVYLSGQN